MTSYNPIARRRLRPITAFNISPGHGGSSLTQDIDVSPGASLSAARVEGQSTAQQKNF